MIANYFEGVLLGLAIAVSIGPVFFALIETGITQGPKMAVSVALGIFFSDFALIVTAFLFSSIISSILSNASWLQLVASVFFIAFGLMKIFAGGNGAQNTRKPVVKRRTYLQYFAKGFVVNCMHPGLFVFWVAIVGFYSVKYPEGSITFFTGVLTTTLGADILKSIFAIKLKKWITPRHLKKVSLISGIIFVTFGLLFLFDYLGFSLRHLI